MANRYQTTPTVIREGKQLKASTVFTTPPASEADFYVISTTGDRFDLLAKEYYNDVKLWYVIAAANPDVRRDTLNITPGIQLRIPLPAQRVVEYIERQNSIR